MYHNYVGSPAVAKELVGIGSEVPLVYVDANGRLKFRVLVDREQSDVKSTPDAGPKNGSGNAVRASVQLNQIEPGHGVYFMLGVCNWRVRVGSPCLDLFAKQTRAHITRDAGT